MAENTINPTLAGIIRDIHRRLRLLEAAPQLQNSSLTGGTVTALNADGDRVAEFGALIGGNYGFAVNEAASLHTLMLVDDADGWSAPVWQHAWRDASASVGVTSGSFTPVYRTRIPVTMSTVILTSVVTIQDAATTGELRLTIEGVTSTTAKTLPAGVQTDTTFSWEHGQDLGLGGDLLSMIIEARRTAGAGTIHVFHPDPLESCSAYTPAAGGLLS